MIKVRFNKLHENNFPISRFFMGFQDFHNFVVSDVILRDLGINSRDKLYIQEISIVDEIFPLKITNRDVLDFMLKAILRLGEVVSRDEFSKLSLGDLIKYYLIS